MSTVQASQADTASFILARAKPENRSGAQVSQPHQPVLLSTTPPGHGRPPVSGALTPG